jgi:type IV secretory pathway TrbF-like protein
MGITTKIKSAWHRDKWVEPPGLEPRDEYERARWVAEGEGAGATKAALALGTAVVGLSIACVALGVLCYSLYQNSNKVKIVAVPANIGETNVFKATVVEGELQSNTAIEQWIIARWIDQVRGVPLDPVAYNRGYFEAQYYMCSSVQARIDATVKPDANNPDKLTPEKMLKQGVTRRVHVRNITPRGGESNSYRLDWFETLYQNSKAISQANATADLELKYFPPANATAATHNPYGAYICAFDWSASPG